MASALTDSELLSVEVVYALPDRQVLLSLDVLKGTNAQQVAELSGLAERFALDTSTWALGLWGRAFGTQGLPQASDYPVMSGDRIEIYRPLQCDPKEARRQRAAKAASRT